MRPLDYEDWAPFYLRIAKDFGYDTRRDEDAALALAKRLAAPPFSPGQVWAEAQRRIQGSNVIVLGAADSAAEDLARLRTAEPVVAADGATTASLEAGVVPALIVSDLDGNLPDEVRAVERGSLLLVHAHGDNRAAVEEWLPRFPPAAVAGTCQTRPPAPLRNHGGFTDGDRACFLAHALGAQSLRLVGFRPSARPGRYTGRFDPATKPRKLEWSRLLLRELVARGAVIEDL